MVRDSSTIAGRTAAEADRSRAHPPGWLLAGFLGCVVIAIAAVLRRLVELLRAPHAKPLGMPNLDAVFASHATLTVAHIVPAAIFVVLSAAVLLRRERSAWLEPFFFVFGAITGLTAYAMGWSAIGGWIELSAVLVFDTLFLFSLARAYQFRLQGDAVRQREWMLRAVGVLLGIATTRPVMGVFFATSRMTQMTPQQFFGIAFWIGFSINTIITEIWVRLGRRGSVEI